MSIELDREKGVNPRVTICVDCGKDVGVALLGRHDGLYKCRDCGGLSVGGKPHKNRPGHLGFSECPKCGAHDSYEWVGKIPEHEKLPIERCDECAAKQKAADDEVKAGGVYWKCEDCQSRGAIRAEAPLSKAVREKTGISPPDPVGVQFSKDHDCPACGPSAAENQ